MGAPVALKDHDPAFRLIRVCAMKKEHQSLKVTLPQPAPGCSRRLDNRAQLIWVASEDNIGIRIRESHYRDHHKRFLCLCSLVDDYVTEMLGGYIQVLEYTCLGAGRE